MYLVKDVSILPCLFFISEKGGRELDFRVHSVRLLPFMVKLCFRAESNISFYSVSEKEPVNICLVLFGHLMETPSRNG